MSRSEARGHNYKNPISAPRFSQAEQDAKIRCVDCDDTMQAVVNSKTGKPFERCFTCEEKRSGPGFWKRRRG